jgi:acyl-CoA reductase-like NAD-dependent aldehyde dehydrogenase
MGPHIPRGARGLSETPPQSPVFVIHALMHAIAALSAATEAGRPVVLLSAPGAGIYAGPGWFKALVDAAREAAPEARLSAVLDCGDNPGAAQGAIRAGIASVIFTGRQDVAERLAGIAAQAGVRLLTDRPAAAFDLRDLFFADPATLRRYCAECLASLRVIC